MDDRDQPRKLTRATDDRVLGGVAGGLGRYFSVDPIIFRIGFVVLVFVGGTGVLAYLAAVLFVPDEGKTAPLAARRKVVAIAGVVVLAIAALSFLGSFGSGWYFWGPGPGLLGVAVVTAAGVLLWRAIEGDGIEARTLAARAAIVLVIAVGAGLAACAVAVAAAAGTGAVIAAVVIVLGLALAATAFAGGGARWLILPALVLAAPVAVVSAADLDVGGGAGEREYRPASVADLRSEYALGVGEVRLDLRDLRLPAGDTDVKLDVGMGRALVLLPEGACVAYDLDVDAGYVEALDRDEGGVGLDWRHESSAVAGAPRVRIDADVGLGAVQIGHGPGFDRFDRGDAGDDNRACEA